MEAALPRPDDHDAVAAANVDHELYRFDAGHASMVVDQQIDQLARCIAFVARHLGTPEPIGEPG